VEFVLDQDMAAVFGGEAGDEGFSVLGDVARKVGGCADIVGAVSGAGHDVGGGLRSGGGHDAGLVGELLGRVNNRSTSMGAWVASPHSGFAMTAGRSRFVKRGCWERRNVGALFPHFLSLLLPVVQMMSS
jgi:hypothetical protein